MKTKTPIKILTLTLFVALISGFTLYKAGYLFTQEKKVVYISDPNGGTEAKLKTVAEEDFGLNTFQKLKMKGAFNPEYFDEFYTAPIFIPPDPHHFLSSSKSMLISDYGYSKQRTVLHDSFLSILLNQQLDTIKYIKKK